MWPDPFVLSLSKHERAATSRRSPLVARKRPFDKLRANGGRPINRAARLPRPFTLVEMLAVMAIIFIILGVGISGIKRIGRDATLSARGTALHQLVRNTLESAKSERVPLQIDVDVPLDGTTTVTSLLAPCTVQTSAAALISYWSFESTTNVGILGQTLTAMPPAPGEGFVGNGLIAAGTQYTVSSAAATDAAFGQFQYPRGFYMEAMIKPDYGSTASAAVLSAFGCTLNVAKDATPPGFTVSSAPATATSRMAIDNGWHKVGLKVSIAATANADLYLDDVFIGRAAVGNPSGKTVTIGSGGYRGFIDEVKIYSFGVGDTIVTDPKDSIIVCSSQLLPTANMPHHGSFPINPRGALEEYMAADAVPTTGISEKASASISVASTVTFMSLAADPGAAGTTISCKPSPTLTSFSRDGGYVTIDYELIRYAYLNKDGLPILEGCERGVGGTKAAAHTVNVSEVRLAKPVLFYRNGGVK